MNIEKLFNPDHLFGALKELECSIFTSSPQQWRKRILIAIGSVEAMMITSRAVDHFEVTSLPLRTITHLTVVAIAQSLLYKLNNGDEQRVKKTVRDQLNNLEILRSLHQRRILGHDRNASKTLKRIHTLISSIRESTFIPCDMTDVVLRLGRATASIGMGSLLFDVGQLFGAESITGILLQGTGMLVGATLADSAISRLTVWPQLRQETQDLRAVGEEFSTLKVQSQISRDSAAFEHKARAAMIVANCLDKQNGYLERIEPRLMTH